MVGTCVCIMKCPKQATMHEAALGAVLVFSSEALLLIGGAREWCSVGQAVQECGHCLACGGRKRFYLLVYVCITCPWTGEVGYRGRVMKWREEERERERKKERKRKPRCLQPARGR